MERKHNNRLVWGKYTKLLLTLVCVCVNRYNENAMRLISVEHIAGKIVRGFKDHKSKLDIMKNSQEEASRIKDNKQTVQHMESSFVKS